jgi:hypothetical protein
VVAEGVEVPFEGGRLVTRPAAKSRDLKRSLVPSSSQTIQSSAATDWAKVSAHARARAA